MPVFNVERYLRECLDSVVAQTLSDIEIICVNDGSTDRSLTILEEYAAKDDRVKIIDKENSGYGHTMNVGIDAAAGEYIGVVETDDYVDRDMFGTLSRMAAQYGLDVIKSDYQRFTGEGRERIFKTMKLSNDHNMYGKILDPQKDALRLFSARMMTWTGIYRRDF